MLIKRFLELDIPQGQSCFLWGAHKTGKSTYLKEQFLNGIYILICCNLRIIKNI